MKYSNYNELLDALLATTFSQEICRILDDIGDHPDIALDQPFGSFHLSWHAFGNNLSNISTVNLATKPGRSLTERLTNAMDAILEDRLPHGIPEPRSAREAAQQWFGRPISKSDDGLFRWNFSEQGHDRRICVVMNPSDIESCPTIDVIDDGIGIAPDQFSETILSLHQQNKIRKWYLIGAFGQGGASTLAFCDYALIISRHKDNPHIIGFTVIKVLKLNEQYKEDTYAYLATNDTDGNLTVPSCTIDNELHLYKKRKGIRLPSLAKGTIVRHISYKLPDLDGNLGPAPGNLYHYLHYTMFDPLLPFRLIDLRTSGRERDELITGSRNRLMKLVMAKNKSEDQKEARQELRHHRQMEFIVPPETDDPCIGIEYWVVFNFKKIGKSKTNEMQLRPQSNLLFIQRAHPAIGTLNGQNQGELTSTFLRDLGLSMVARHIVIHIDSTLSDARVRRELFATTREGFKEGNVKTAIARVLNKMLEEDETLYEIEHELTERLVKREAKSTSDEVKTQVTKLLLEAGLEVQEEGPSVTKGSGEEEPVRISKQAKIRVLAPLPTLPFPQVTKFEITYPTPKMEMHLNDVSTILAETDADAEFDRRGLIAVRSEPDRIELAAKSPLKGGRTRWRMRCRDGAMSGEIGKIIITLTKPDGAQLTDMIDYEILPVREEKTKKSKRLIPPFEIIPINPEDNTDTWNTVWPNFDESSNEEAYTAVAYKPLKIGDAINVYYSTIFRPFREDLDKIKMKSPSLLELFRTNYEIWIGYHAILQENSRREIKENIEEESLDKLLEFDRVRVAEMQVKQALKTAELMHKGMRDRAELS